MLYLRILLPALILSLIAPSCKTQCRNQSKMNGMLLTGTYDFGRSKKYQKKNSRSLKRNKDCVRWAKR